ncbi:MAG: hypothetical protein ACLU9Q_09690 [Marvinbryantia sp.]|uniref:hypothetical protein n=1 Tax=Marvinbryantia sp. TaxID=2496532 RepID=UPI00399976C9
MKRSISVFLLMMTLFVMTGCSRATMNAQIAESIGTLGQYENNEPVETPKMKAQREIQEQKEAAEEDVTGHLNTAARLAASYDYTAALEEIAKISEEHAEDDRVISAKIEYQRLLGQMVEYGGDVAHFSVKTLVADPSRAFDGDDMSSYYNNWTLTVDEFKAILQSLYDRGYVLMDVHEKVVDIQNEDGTTSFAVNTPSVPEGKTPMVLSFTEANYYDYQQGDGFAGRLVLDENGNVMNEYTDASGQTLIGAYDVIPIVDEFVEEHPDFSLRGAKGIVSVTGYEGVFGYGIETGASTIAAIADRLKETGWEIACQGFSDNTMESDLDLDELEGDLDTWSSKIGSLVGDTDLLIYPYGEEVTAGTAKQELLLEKGYQFFFSIWTTADFIEVQPDYVRQTRRTLDGYDLYMYADYLTDFFDVDEIFDKTRPAFE